MKNLIAVCLFCSFAIAQTPALMGGLPKFNYTTGDVVIVIDGNSIPAGYSATTGSAFLLNAIKAAYPWSGSNVTVYNYAVSGQNTGQMISDAASQIDTLLTGGKKGVLIAWEITNDILDSGLNGGGQTVEQAKTRYQTYCAARRTAGYKVIAVTTLPRNRPDPFNANLDEINTWLKANYRNFADGLVDVRQASGLATLPSSNIPDGIHPNDAGLTLFVDLLKPALLRLRK